MPIALQVLIYPMLDDRTGLRSTPGHVETKIWSRAANRYAWGAFFGVAPGSRHVPSAAVPARVLDLAGLAPAFIGAVHGFDDISVGTSVVEQFMALKLDALRRAFGIQAPDARGDATAAAAFRTA